MGSPRASVCENVSATLIASAVCRRSRSFSPSRSEKFCPLSASLRKNFAHPPTAFLFGGPPEEADHQLVGKAWEQAQTVLTDPDYDLLVLDEINNALHHRLLNVAEVLQALRNRPAHQEVICTGRNAPAELIEAADLVTEMTLIKHPYHKDVPARRGIEI